MQDPNDLEVVFGASAVFKCKAEGDPTPDIKWMRNSNEIDSSDSRVRVQIDGTLQIDRIDTRDQGVYNIIYITNTLCNMFGRRNASNGESIDRAVHRVDPFKS